MLPSLGTLTAQLSYFSVASRVASFTSPATLCAWPFVFSAIFFTCSLSMFAFLAYLNSQPAGWLLKQLLQEVAVPARFLRKDKMPCKTSCKRTKVQSQILLLARMQAPTPLWPRPPSPNLEKWE